ncbi:SET domain-containing protein [Imleria badia]|nr:SET domain-containing protein [Imleria badia]
MSSPSADSAELSIFAGSSYLELQSTTLGGRSLFAISDVAPGTRIHSCKAPFAHVIYKDYRKEVCAHCFAYSASDHAPPTVGSSRTWSIKWSQAGAATTWFCSDGCKDSWERDEASTLMLEVDALLTKGQASTRKRCKSLEEEVEVKSILPCFESGDRSITQEVIDAAWESAKALVASRAHLTLYYSTLHLEDTELEIARSLAAAIVRRYSDERLSQSDPTCNQFQSWSQLLNLQKNELCNVQARPYMLTAYLRIYVLLSNALPKYLRKYMSTVREVLARDTGNAFGIWDGDQRDEMMGWGIWVSASYFNHSCMPNVRKKRVGRTLHFEATRGIQAGEELCISYIDTDSPADQRRRELEESWFFSCRCLRCEKETTE